MRWHVIVKFTSNELSGVRSKNTEELKCCNRQSNSAFPLANVAAPRLSAMGTPCMSNDVYLLRQSGSPWSYSSHQSVS